MPYRIEANHIGSVISYSLCDDRAECVVAETLERLPGSATVYPLAPRGYQNAVVMAHAWEMLSAMRAAMSSRCIKGAIGPTLDQIETALRREKNTNAE
jgi:hypothetical protein